MGSNGEDWPEGGSTAATSAPASRSLSGASKQLALYVLRGTGFEAHALPEGGQALIGRAPGCDIRIEERSVSRSHAILRSAKGLTIEDLGSHNGTYIGDARLVAHEEVPVGMDQVIRLGSITAVILPDEQTGPAGEVVGPGELETRLDRECARARKTGQDVAVIHVRSDDPFDPAEVARTAQATVPNCVMVGRFGPCDYRILSVNVTIGQCEPAVDRLAQRLRERCGMCRVVAQYHPRRGDEGGDTSAPALEHGRSLIVENAAMIQLYEQARRLAAGTISVLVHGETGVGKESVAEAIHRFSARASRPFLRLNCAAFTDTLLESQLFGHEKGAFTGAVSAKPGLLEAANGGTVFLDEVGELSMSAQVKLLRCLEDGTVLRVGAVSPRPIDVRFVAATNRNLEREIERGAFREDLFYRIAAATLRVPALRERVDEIVPLAEVFIADASRQLGVVPPALSEEAREVLTRYAWPGNIRELRNVIERAVLLCTDVEIRPHHLPTERLSPGLAVGSSERVRTHSQTVDLGGHYGGEPMPGGYGPDDDERQRVLDALAECGGNQTKAARLLGISRATLAKRLERYGIPRPRK